MWETACAYDSMSAPPRPPLMGTKLGISFSSCTKPCECLGWCHWSDPLLMNLFLKILNNILNDDLSNILYNYLSACLFTFYTNPCMLSKQLKYVTLFKMLLYQLSFVSGGKKLGYSWKIIFQFLRLLIITAPSLGKIFPFLF